MAHKTLVVIAVCAALGGCAQMQGVFGNSTAQQDVEKSLTVAHLAHKGLADELKYAADTGLLHGQNAVTARTYLDKSEVLLQQADSAFAAGQSISSQLNEATALMSQAAPLVPNSAKQ